jgi:3-oxoacyl-[acyl-carrier protein] reductase
VPGRVYNPAVETETKPGARPLLGRAALVTGAGRSIGAAVARRLAADGAHVVLGDVDLAAASEVAASIGSEASAVALDVRSRSSFEDAVEAVVRDHGGIDVLVNNAALTIARPFFEIPDDEWDDVLAVNLRGVFLGCQVAGARMRDQRSGRIVNLSSTAGQQGSAVNGAHYAASKAGILGLTKSAALELASFGVTVNAVAPAAIEGPLVDALPAAKRTALVGAIPVGRLGRPEEIAALIAFLASDEAGYITGATLDANGGMLRR